MRKFLAATAILTAGLLAGPTVAGADVTFGGDDAHCDVYGSATFDKPLTGTPGENTYHFLSTVLTSGPNANKATACTGTLNGIRVDRARVTARVDGSGTLSCGTSRANGAPGTLTFLGTGQVLKFTLDIVGFGTEVVLSVKGEKSGTGSGQATFRDDPDASPDRAAATCGPTGNGFRALDFAAAFDGESTLVSSSPPESSGGGAGGGGTGGGGTGGGGAGGGGGGTGAGTTRTSYTFRAITQKLKAALKRGIGVSLRGNAPAKATLKAQLDAGTANRLGFGRKVVTIGSATINLTRAGSASGFVKLKASAKRKLKNARSVRVKLVGTIRDVTQRSTPVNKIVLLR